MINNAVNAAVLKGVVVVASGGNDGDLACKKSPASAESAITVGAVDRYNSRPSYSNYGSCIDIFGYVARLLVLYSGVLRLLLMLGVVHLIIYSLHYFCFRPGSSITSAWYSSSSATNTLSGTSMATPVSLSPQRPAIRYSSHHFFLRLL